MATNVRRFGIENPDQYWRGRVAEGRASEKRVHRCIAQALRQHYPEGGTVPTAASATAMSSGSAASITRPTASSSRARPSHATNSTDRIAQLILTAACRISG